MITLCPRNISGPSQQKQLCEIVLNKERNHLDVPQDRKGGEQVGERGTELDHLHQCFCINIILHFRSSPRPSVKENTPKPSEPGTLELEVLGKMQIQTSTVEK